jgi:hypothetical protein
MDELDAMFRSYCDSAEMTYHPEVADSPWQLYVKGNPTFAVIVGETIQNIRTALDYLVYSLVLHTRGRKPKNMTQFPLSATAGDFFSKRYQIAELPGELRRRIRKLQPYQTKSQRSASLNLLRRLSNADKHRLLVVMDARIGGHGLRRGVQPTRETIGVVIPGYLEGTEFEQHVLRRDPNIASVTYFSLMFREQDSGSDAFETLKTFLWTATEIIDGFEDACV